MRIIKATSWDLHFIKMAELVASKSKDPNTKIGAVIVGPDNEIRSTGFNGFPRGIDEETFPERWERPDKYKWVVHAEANAVANAARVGIPLKGSTMYMNFQPCPCADGCAGLLIQSGIIRIVGPNKPYSGSKNLDVTDIADIMLTEVNMDRVIVVEQDNETE